MKKYILSTLFVANFSVALPFNSQDTISRSMGGAGVASSNPGSASQFNPALLSHYREDQDFSIVFPNISASLKYKKEVKDALQRINDESYIPNIRDSITNLNRLSQQTFRSNVNQLVTNTDALSGSLRIISGRPVTATVTPFDITLSFPGEKFGFAIYTNTSLHVQAVPHVSECDLQLMKGFADLLESISPSNPQIPTDNTRIDLNCEERQLSLDLVRRNNGNNQAEFLDFTQGKASDGKSFLLSSAEAALLVINETGISISHQFVIKDTPISIGITPKYLSVATAYAFPTVKSISDNTFDTKDYLKDNYQRDGDFSSDFGLAVDFLNDRSLTVGLVVKNMIPHTYESLPFNRFGDDSKQISQKFTVDTQVRAGVSFEKYGFIIATDIDLTENSPLFFGNSTQFAAFGIEYDIADVNIVKLRAGAKINMKDKTDNTFSGGLGVNIFALHLDLGAEMGDEYLAGAMQLGLDF